MSKKENNKSLDTDHFNKNAYQKIITKYSRWFKEIEIKCFYIEDDQGLIHSEHLPAIIIKYSNVDIKLWYHEGRLYKKHGAASISKNYPFNGSTRFSKHEIKNSSFPPLKALFLKEKLSLIEKEADLLDLIFYILDQHKSFSFSGPAEIEKNKNGTKKETYYNIDHQIHRIDGPAVIYFDEKDKNKILKSAWFIEGKAIY